MGTKLIEMGDIKFKELASEIKRLNDSGLVEQKINAVGKTKEELVDLFVKGVQAIPDDSEGNWTGPDEIAKYYMTLLAPVAEVKKKAVAVDKQSKKKTTEPKKKDEKDKKKGRLELAAETIYNANNVSVEELINMANDQYVANGGSDNVKESGWAIKMAIRVLTSYQILTITDGLIVKL